MAASLKCRPAIASLTNHVLGVNNTLPPLSPAFAIASATCSNPWVLRGQQPDLSDLAEVNFNACI